MQTKLLCSHNISLPPLRFRKTEGTVEIRDTRSQFITPSQFVHSHEVQQSREPKYQIQS